MNEELDRIVAERIQQKEAEDKAKAEAQVEYAKAKGEAEAKEMSLIAQDTNKALQTKLNLQLANHVETSPEVAEKVKLTATKLVDKGLEIQDNKVEKELKETEKEKNVAEFELDEDNYRAFGQSIAPSKTWKKKLIELGSDFWFVILYIISFFTIAPFYFFIKEIKTQSGVLKFVAIAVGVLLLLGCLGGLTYGCLDWTGVI